MQVRSGERYVPSQAGIAARSEQLPAPRSCDSCRRVRVFDGEGRMKRVARTLIVGGLVALAACYKDDVSDAQPAGSTVNILLTDAPFPYDLVERVDVYVVEIAASAQVDTGPSQNWVTIARPRRRFNLLELQQGTTTLVGQGELPADVYRAVRITLDADSSVVTLQGGGQAAVDWQTTVPVFSIHTLVESPIDVPRAGADIVIDFD